MADHSRKNADEKNRRLSALRSELETLNEDVKKAVRDVEGDTDGRIHLALRKAEEVAHRAYRLAEESAAHVVHDVDDWAVDKADMARRSIRAQPISALALSIGVGALIGMMVTRR
jgi:ElaB/YqjD/DUF883 family membrane-anchored ribosome-binding protein